MKATWVVPDGRLRSVDFLVRDYDEKKESDIGLFSVKASELDDDPSQEGYYWGILRRDGGLVLMAPERLRVREARRAGSAAGRRR